MMVLDALNGGQPLERGPRQTLSTAWKQIRKDRRLPSMKIISSPRDFRPTPTNSETWPS